MNATTAPEDKPNVVVKNPCKKILELQLSLASADIVPSPGIKAEGEGKVAPERVIV